MTDTGRSPARRSKIVAGALSAGALVAIVTGLAATSHGGQLTPTSGAVSGGGQTVTRSLPTPVPGAAPARGTPTVPHAVSKASGG